MRPVSLELSGLHSFRTRRLIEFEPLLQENLFGIFGPTGSGKSTILDAITLALFGRIERTKGNAIITVVNSRCDECSVAFTFDIRHEGEYRRYRVERNYKIRKSSSRSEARLIEIKPDGTEVPLTDKAKETADALNEIIGISPEDFSRAVVLPQGAFAEFLGMGGRERSDMLKRIFGLEEVSNRIEGRMKEILSRLKTERAGLDTELAILAEYNDEALTARTEELQQATAEVEKGRNRVEQLQATLATNEELLALITDVEDLQQKRGEREEAAKEITTLRTRLDRAELALELRDVVRSAEEGEKEYEETARNYTKATREKEEIERKITPLIEQKKSAEDARSEGGKIPRLRGEIEQLERIAEIAERIENFNREIGTQKEEIEAIGEELTKGTRRMEEMTRSLSESGKRRDDLTASIAKQESDIEQLLLRHGQLSPICSLLGAEEQLQSEIAVLREEGGEIRKKEEEGRERLASHRRDLLTREEELKRLKAEEEEIRYANVVALAAERLTPGEPCPLCGSTEHPLPFHTPDDPEHDRRRRRIAELEPEIATLTEQLRSLEQELTRNETARSEKVRSQKEREVQLQKKESESSSLLKAAGIDRIRFDELNRQLQQITSDGTGLRTSLREAKEELQKREEERTTSETARHELQNRQTLLEERRRLLSESILATTAKRDEEIAEKTRRLEESGLPHEITDYRRERDSRKEKLDVMERKAAEIDKRYQELNENLVRARHEHDRLFTEEINRRNERDLRNRKRDESLKNSSFATIEEWQGAYCEQQERETMRRRIEELSRTVEDEKRRIAEGKEKIGGRRITAAEVERERQQLAEERGSFEQAQIGLGQAQQSRQECEEKNRQWKEAKKRNSRQEKESAAAQKLNSLLRGNAFIDFIATERLRHVCRTASTELKQITGGRLELDVRPNEGFVILDYGNGGVERSTGSLSGGESFVVSLSLALALSESLQLRGAPLEFFFLDEGFGTLDVDLLEIVMNALDRIRSESRRAIGVISHVRELQERIPRRLLVTPADEMDGSDVRMVIT